MNLMAVLSALGYAALGYLLAGFTKEKIKELFEGKLPPYILLTLQRSVYYAILAIFAVLALNALGFKLTGLLVAGGILGIALGFASQATVSNVLSGLLLFFERPMLPGDAVDIDGISGKVVEITPLSTRIQTWNGPVVRLPNEAVFKAKITNLSTVKARRFEYEIGISYESDVEKALEVISRVLEEEPYVLVEPAPEVYLKALADSALIIKIKAWAPTEKAYVTSRDLLQKIYLALKKNGIEIPYPQLDVHLKK